MLSINLQARIFADYHAGKEYTNGTKYRYTLQYNPLALVHTWIIRQNKSGSEWHFFAAAYRQYAVYTTQQQTEGDINHVESYCRIYGRDTN